MSETKVFTASELKQYTGENGMPIYVCIKGVVYDVSSGAGFYGPGKGYSSFAGRDASRALAVMVVQEQVIYPHVWLSLSVLRHVCLCL